MASIDEVKVVLRHALQIGRASRAFGYQTALRPRATLSVSAGKDTTRGQLDFFYYY